MFYFYFFFFIKLNSSYNQVIRVKEIGWTKIVKNVKYLTQLAFRVGEKIYAFDFEYMHNKLGRSKVRQGSSRYFRKCSKTRQRD